MQLYYYIQRGEQQFGPYLSDALLDYVAQGNITLNDLVFLEDSQTWTTLENSPLIQNMLGAVSTQNDAPVSETIAESASTPPLPTVPRRPAEIEPELNLEMIETEAPVDPVTVIQTTQIPTREIADSELFNLIFNEGVAQIEIEPTSKGQVTMGIQDGQAETLTIEIRSARAVRLVLQNEDRQAVGSLASVIVTAEDEFGNIDESCNAELTIKYSGSAMGVGRIQLKNGIGNFAVSNEKATVSSFVVGAGGEWSDLKTTDGAIEFLAGPAIRFEIHAPTSVQAGQKTQVHVLALDQFGNQTSRVEADVRLAIQHFVS